jgi:hypothetical protein
LLKGVLIASLVAVCTALCSSALAAPCPNNPYTLTNGATADATQVMANFNNLLTCANTLAPLANPTFTGTVGIGTAPTNYALTIQAGGPVESLNNTDSTSYGSYRFQQSGTIVGALQFFGPNFVTGSLQNTLELETNLSTGAIAFFVGPEVMRVTHVGLGIGTTAPGQALHVVGTIRQTGCTTAGTLSANTSGDIICTSDGRLKNILGDFTSGLEALTQIAPKRFTYKTTSSDPVETFVHAGFIAQNVMGVIPQASALQHDGYFSLDTTAILAAAVNSIKQLKSIGDKQATVIATQAAEIANLKSRLQQYDARFAVLDARLGIRTAADARGASLR